MHTIYRELGWERLPWDKQNKEWGSFLKGGIFFLSSSVSLPLVCAVVRQAGATTKAASSVDHSRNESVEMSTWESASYGRITEWVLRIVVEGKTIGPCAATRDTPSVCKQHLDLLIYLFIYSFIAAADLIQGFVYASRVLYCWAMAPALDFETRMSLVDRKKEMALEALGSTHTGWVGAKCALRPDGFQEPMVEKHCFSGPAHCRENRSSGF